MKYSTMVGKKRELLSSSEDPDDIEAKRLQMDVPPAFCLRSRRPRETAGTDVAFAPRGEGNDSATLLDADNRLGSLSGEYLGVTGDKEELYAQNEVKTLETQDKATDAQSEKQTENEASASETTSVEPNKPKLFMKKSPKQLLNEYYNKLKVSPSTKSQYTTVKHDKVARFSSAFTCHITGENFMSGRMKDIEFLEENGAAWYSKS